MLIASLNIISYNGSLHTSSFVVTLLDLAIVYHHITIHYDRNIYQLTFGTYEISIIWGIPESAKIMIYYLNMSIILQVLHKRVLAVPNVYVVV